MTEYQRQWRRDNPDKVKAANARYRLRLKIEALNHYGGGKPECYCCGEQAVEFLGIDHMDNDGAEERKLTGGGHAAYRWLKTNGYPDRNYKVACQNCNSARFYYGNCPHQPFVRGVA